ncbi:Redoxin [Lipomyces tetrasporus]|uniref:Redoxin n=1 Tax=Lipomyces tetrasporus TaxID=54092 RepID=A0AAD7QSG7_9ASCO|nr:Redoxin [Lipomyces tetrasporus]KAJ8100456.1 Redoxin [Lipomyces tetrasporus]
MTLTAGDKFPEGVKFLYIAYTPDTADIKACGIPIPLDFDKEFGDKTVVIVSIPGAFTPTCTANHIPPYVEKFASLKSKGVDAVIVLSANDPFVQSAFGKANGVTDEFFIFASDPAAEFSKSVGLSLDLPAAFGTRTARYAMIVSKGVVKYVEKDASEVAGSGVDAVLAAL